MNDEQHNVIEIEGLVKQFGDQTVLDGINLQVHPGETMVIMGGSGSGKSTLLRHMIGTFMPNEGSVRLFGEDLAEQDEAGLNEIRSSSASCSSPGRSSTR